WYCCRARRRCSSATKCLITARQSKWTKPWPKRRWLMRCGPAGPIAKSGIACRLLPERRDLYATARASPETGKSQQVGKNAKVSDTLRESDTYTKKHQPPLRAYPARCLTPNGCQTPTLRNTTLHSWPPRPGV